MEKNFLKLTKNNLSSFELDRLHTFQVLEKANKLNKLNLKYLKSKLNFSSKQIYRFIKEYQDGSFVLKHQNKGKSNARIKPKWVDQQIVKLYIDTSETIKSFRNENEFYLSHKMFYEEYVENKFDVKYNYVNSLLNNNFLVTKNTKRKTRRALKKKYRNMLANNQEISVLKSNLDLINNFEYSFIDYQKEKHIPYVKHNKQFGEVVEVDACVEKWFNNEKYYLYHAIDAGTGSLLAIHIEKEETNKGYASLLKQLFENHGAPIEIRTDRRTSFWNRDGGDTNLSYCLKELEIQVKTNSEPTFKPNVERSFKNAQNLYPFLFVKYKINTLQKALEFLPKLICLYNQKFKRTNKNKTNQFVTLSKHKINDSLFYKKILKVHKGFYVYFENKALCLVNSEKKRMQMTNKIVLRKNFLTNEIFTISNNKKLFFEEINQKLIDNYLDEFASNEYLKLEREKQKQIAINRKIREQIGKKENYLKQKEIELNQKEIELQNKFFEPC